MGPKNGGIGGIGGKVEGVPAIACDHAMEDSVRYSVAESFRIRSNIWQIFLLAGTAVGVEKRRGSQQQERRYSAQSTPPQLQRFLLLRSANGPGWAAVPRMQRAAADHHC